jgi:hypothetical protein
MTAHREPADHSYADWLIADPGDTETIRGDRSGIVLLTTAGAETRTLAAPTRVGLDLVLCLTAQAGTCTVTAGDSGTFNVTADNTLTFTAVGATSLLRSVNVGGTLLWRAFCTDDDTDPALSTV